MPLLRYATLRCALPCLPATLQLGPESDEAIRQAFAVVPSSRGSSPRSAAHRPLPEQGPLSISSTATVSELDSVWPLGFVLLNKDSTVESVESVLSNESCR